MSVSMLEGNAAYALYSSSECAVWLQPSWQLSPNNDWMLLCAMPTSSQLSTRARSLVPTPSRCPALSWYLLARYLQLENTKLLKHMGVICIKRICTSMMDSKLHYGNKKPMQLLLFLRLPESWYMLMQARQNPGA